MTKEEKIINLLNYYVLSNKLQTTVIDKKNNYSIADNIYGSMILATAYASEFKESINLAKILKMQVLVEYKKINPTFSLVNNLVNGAQLEELATEGLILETKDSKLAEKYKYLDIQLTKLIKENENTSYEELSKKALYLLNKTNKEDDSKYKEIFRFYYLNYSLKDKIRSGCDKKHWNVNAKRVSRVSEHIVNTITLAMGIKAQFDYNIDLNKVIETLSIHEMGENIIGDITPFDGMTKEQKIEIEHKAMIYVLGNLKDKESLKNKLFEFDERKTSNSIYIHFCDKLQADLNSKIYQDLGQQRPLSDQKENVVFGSPIVKQMIDNGATTVFDIWYEWDKHIYENNEEFKEFSKILDTVNSNDLFKLNNRELTNTSKKLILKRKNI